jgi:hypothetical protein
MEDLAGLFRAVDNRSGSPIVRGFITLTISGSICFPLGLKITAAIRRAAGKTFPRLLLPGSLLHSMFGVWRWLLCH